MEADPEDGTAKIFNGATGTGLINTVLDVIETEEPDELFAVTLKL